MHLVYLVAVELHYRTFSCSMMRSLRNFNSLTFSLEARIDNPDFERIEQNIRHFLRSEQLSKVRVVMNSHAYSNMLMLNFSLHLQIQISFQVRACGVLPNYPGLHYFTFQGHFEKLTHKCYRQEPSTLLLGGGVSETFALQHWMFSCRSCMYFMIPDSEEYHCRSSSHTIQHCLCQP